MKYPKIWRKFINGTALFSGGVAFVIAALQTTEAIRRYVFASPSKWALNVSEYMLIFLVFIGSAYAFQEHGHVAVDMLLNAMDKLDKSGKQRPRRVLAIIGYSMALIFTGCLFKGTWGQFTKALRLHRMTTYIPEIPQFILYIPMILGFLIMSLTLIFMILDIIAGGTEHL